MTMVTAAASAAAVSAGVAGAAVAGAGGPAAAMPAGFFDDKSADARARGVKLYVFEQCQLV